MTGERVRWWRLAAACIVLAVAADVTLSVVARRHDAVLVAALVVCTVVGARLALEAATTVAPEARFEPPATESGTGGDAPDALAASYHRLLSSHASAREPNTRLQERLLELAETRLQQEYGVTAADDPVRATRLLGPELVALHTSRPLRLTPDRIDVLLERIERL